MNRPPRTCFLEIRASDGRLIQRLTECRHDDYGLALSERQIFVWHARISRLPNLQNNLSFYPSCDGNAGPSRGQLPEEPGRIVGDCETLELKNE